MDLSDGIGTAPGPGGEPPQDSVVEGFSEESGSDLNARAHLVMLSMLQLDAGEPGSVRPKDVIRLCGNDPELILEVIRLNEQDEIAWRQARDAAVARRDYEESDVCENERAHAERTVRVLRRALRRVLLPKVSS